MIKFYPQGLKPKMNICKLFFLSVLLFFGNLCRGQDIHFTQFDYSPLFLNPGNTGKFVGDWRLAGNFRDQWKSTADGFRTASLSFDKQFYIFGRIVGAGLLFVNDESGASGLAYNKLYASIGFNREILSNFISAGLQIGIASVKFADMYSLPSDYNHSIGGFDQNNLGVSDFYPDVNVGITWRRNISIFEPEIGVAVSHVNRPKHSLFDNKEVIPLKSVVYTTLETNFNDNIYLTPKIMLMQSSKNELTIVGAEIGYNFLGNRSSVKRVFGGAYVRNGLTSDLESLAAQAGATVGRIDIAFSYDMNVSNLSQSGKLGAFEISFIYNSISTVLNSYSIPCERY